jgi:Fe-S cluster assembly protein SufD
VTAKPESTFRLAYETFETESGKRSPDWVRATRRAAMEQFEDLGFPTLDHEDWRFTNVVGIAEGDFGLASETRHPGLAEGLAGLCLEGVRPHAVLVDGRLEPSLSRRKPPKGVTFESLAHALAERPLLVKQHFGRLSGGDADAFTALNTAFFDDGLLVHAGKGVVAESELVVLHVSTAGLTPRMSHPRTLVILETGSELSLVEDHVSFGRGTTFTNSVTEIVVGPNASCRRTLLERESSSAYAVTTVFAEQARDSKFASHAALFGGALVRNNVYPTLDGENCESLVNGLYVTGSSQLHDNYMRVRHAKPHCDSRQFYRGILDGNARAVFSGRIIVHEGAQKTDAKQTNMNLLLSEDARVETRPQLEIYADDVKCTHGATVGQVDDEAIFYLMARGIDRQTARRLLVFAFANEILDRMDLESVREALRSLLTARLPVSRELEVAR